MSPEEATRLTTEGDGGFAGSYFKIVGNVTVNLFGLSVPAAYVMAGAGSVSSASISGFSYNITRVDYTY